MNPRRVIGYSVLVQLFGSRWPIPFKQNAQTLPSIEVKLAPPEDVSFLLAMHGNARHPRFFHNRQPLPQVTAEIQLLERARMRLEEVKVTVFWFCCAFRKRAATGTDGEA